MSGPRAEMIARTSDATKPPGHAMRALQPFDWDGVEGLLRQGPGPCWLSVGCETGPHVRPVFAAWTGESFVLATNSSAKKTTCLSRSACASVAVDLDELHLVVEGASSRLTAPAGLEQARQAFQDVFDWPTRVAGDQLDADFAAPSSGGPPFHVYEIRPARAFGFPTADQREPTRWTWDR